MEGYHEGYDEAYNEEELIVLAKGGDREAFSSLIRPSYKMLYSVCYSILGNAEDAKDAAQEAALSAYKNIETFKDRSKFSTWLYKIALNKAKDLLKQKMNREHLPLEEAGASAKTEEGYEAKLVELDLRAALQKLSVQQRELLVLRDVRGLSYEEIASVLEMNLGTVKSGINRARASLLDVLRDMGFQLPKEGRD